jgi:hypothetical protein
VVVRYQRRGRLVGISARGLSVRVGSSTVLATGSSRRRNGARLIGSGSSIIPATGSVQRAMLHLAGKPREQRST